MENNNPEEVQDEPQTSNPEQPEAQKKISKKLLIIIVVVVVVIIAAIAYFGQQIYERIQSDETPIVEEEVVGEVAGEEATGPVAVVNGVEITRERYEFRYNLEAKDAPNRGLDLNDSNTRDFFASQVLDNIVTVELLLQQAKQAGINTTDDAVNGQYQIVVNTLGGEEALNQQLANDNITPEGLRNDIREQLIIENFVNVYSESVGIEITDEEVAEAYDNASTTSEDLPPLEDVAEQIKDQLYQQRSVEAVNQLLESMKEESDIQLLL